MSNPLSLAVNTADTTSTSATQSVPDNAGNPVLDATFSGLLQDEFAQLEEMLEAFPPTADPLENSQWQVLTHELDENGNSLPESEGTEFSLFMAWQEPVSQSQAAFQGNKQLPLTQTQSLQLETALETPPVTDKNISASARIAAQQSNSMENLVKAFLISQAEPSAVDPASISADSEIPTVQTQTSSLGPMTSTQVRNDITAQPITIPPTRPEWGNAMGERLQWMVNNNIQSAEIRLDPPELGSVEIKIVINKDTAQVNFVTHNAQARDALEQAMPRLREMFAETGVSLGDVNVSQESFKQQHAGNENESGANTAHTTATDELLADGSDTDPVSAKGMLTASGSGLLDTYV